MEIRLSHTELNSYTLITGCGTTGNLIPQHTDCTRQWVNHSTMNNEYTECHLAVGDSGDPINNIVCEKHLGMS